MHWAELFDTFAKVGLGLLAGWFLSKETRSHEFEKERRRRKQNFLEYAAECLDELTMAMESMLSSTQVILNAPAESQSHAAEALLANWNVLETAQRKFGNLETKISLFGLPECATTFQQHRRSTLTLAAALGPWRDGGAEPIESRSSWWDTERVFRKTIVTAFAAL